MCAWSSKRVRFMSRCERQASSEPSALEVAGVTGATEEEEGPPLRALVRFSSCAMVRGALVGVAASEKKTSASSRRGLSER
jgi:hypothetical protein